MPKSKAASERMRAESRRQILAAARRLFAQRGYFTCKVSDIAREAGMSQGNVYWYFPTKDDVLRAVLAEGFGALEAVTAEVAARPGTAREKLDYLLDRMLAMFREQTEFVAILGALLAHGGAPLLQQLGFDMEQIGARYHRNLGLVFAQARAEGIVADVDPNLLVVFFFSLFNGLLITYGRDWPDLPAEPVRAAALRLLGVPSASRPPARAKRRSASARPSPSTRRSRHDR